MITTIFKKSTPINYSLVVFLTLVFFFLYQFHTKSESFSLLYFLKELGILMVLFASLFIINFITKKNGLTKDSSFAIFFSFLFFIFFPSVLNQPNLLLSNFFILLALRRLISLQTLKLPKEKIFDASMWIFVASLFHFWSILFIGLVFISIFFHVSRDYRNWVLPFIAFFSVLVLSVFAALVFDKSLISWFIKNTFYSFKINYFTNYFQNISLSIYVTMSLFFVASLVTTLSNRPLILNSSYKKIIAWFFIGIIVFLVSPIKSNGLLLFTVAPLSIMTTLHIEIMQVRWQRELTLLLIILCGFFGFFSQL